MFHTSADAATIVAREIDGHLVGQRRGDGDVNATALCKAAGKKFHDYARNQATGEFVEELERSAGIPANDLIQSKQGQPENGGGTWVHPDVAINLAQWLSPKFAVMVSRWVRELLTTGHVGISDPAAITELLARLRLLEERVNASPVIQAVPRFTVQERLRFKGWLGTTPKQRATVRRLANVLLDMRHGETPDVAGGPGGGCTYYGHQLAVLDEAIDRVREEYAKREGRLFRMTAAGNN